MTDDDDKALVERLREVGRDGVWKSGRNPKTAHPMCIKAADRIEQLEAALRPFIDAIGRIDLSREDGENRVELRWGKGRATAVTVASFTQALAALETKHD